MRFRLIERALLIEDIEAVKKQYPDIPDGDFNAIIKCDPTYTGNNSVGKFTKWVLNQYKKGNVKVQNGHTVYYQGEYGGAIIKELLESYVTALKTQEINKDINSFKTPQDLKSAIQNAPSKQLSKRQKERRLRKSVEGAELVYSDEDWSIFVPKTYEASCTLGAGSGWCTADTRTDSFYHKYLEEDGGQYYILISNFEPEEKYQFHFESEQFMGSGTNPGHTANREYEIDVDEFLDQYPKVKEFFDSQEYEYSPKTYNPSLGVEYYFTIAHQYDDNGHIWADYFINDFAYFISLLSDKLHNAVDILSVRGTQNHFENFYEFDDVYLEDLHNSNTSYELWDKMFFNVNKQLNKDVLNYIDEHIPELQKEIMRIASNKFLGNKEVQETILKTFLGKIGGLEYENGKVRLYATLDEVATEFNDAYEEYTYDTGERQTTDDFIAFLDMFASDEAFAMDTIPSDFNTRQAIIAYVDSTYLEHKLEDINNNLFPTVITLMLKCASNNNEFVNILTETTKSVLEENEMSLNDFPDHI